LVIHGPLAGVHTMIHKSTAVRTSAGIDRRPLPPSMIARKASGAEASGARALGKRLGNQGVQRLISDISSNPPRATPARTPPIQAKLTVSQPGDAHEQEADRVANAVLRTCPSGLADTPAISPATSISKVQRLCADCEEELGRKPRAQVQRKEHAGETPAITPSVAANIQSLRGGGSALPAATRAFFEPRFGADFSNVRVHTGTPAQEIAESISAKAFTVGRNIAFNAGQYAPHSQEGQRLLAHELTHVIQQQGHRADSGVLQRAVCPGGHWRRADDDPTALAAYDKIERAHKALEAAMNDPAVSDQSKAEMAEAIRRSIASLKTYIKEIEGKCSSSSSGGGFPILATTATGVNPLHAAIALFAALLFADTARRVSMSEQNAVDALSHAMGQLANAVRKMAEPIPIRQSTPAPAEPTRTIDPVPPVVPRPEPEPREDDPGRRKKKKIYPICWPTILPPPFGLSWGFTVFLIRTRSPDRDYSGENEKALKRRWERERKGDIVKGGTHIHHVVPLFLGGVDDLNGNGILWPARIHIKGHAWLRHQPQLEGDPIGSDIYASSHAVGTVYYLAGFKASRDEKCGDVKDLE
jgi:hypothetical protein